VLDGLYVGDASSAEELEAAVAAQVTHVINCCGGEVANHWKDLPGIVYLTYKWTDGGSQVILDQRGDILAEVTRFIGEAFERGNGVLIHSYNGQSRSCCVLSAYLMKRYRWSLQKVLEFLKFRGVVAKIKPPFLRQLSFLEKRLAGEASGPLSQTWKGAESVGGDGEEVMLRNTYINVTCQKEPCGDSSARKTSGPQRRRGIVWSDGMSGDRSKLEGPDVGGVFEPCQTSATASKPALKGGMRPNAGGRGGGESAHSVIEIRRKTGVLHCRPEDIVCKRFGVNFRSRTIVLEYLVPALGDLRAHHAMCVDLRAGLDDGHGEGDEGRSDLATAERLRSTHAPWLATVSTDQLAGLVRRLRVAARGGG